MRANSIYRFASTTHATSGTVRPVARGKSLSTQKYLFPECLEGLCAPEAYRRWLHNKARSHSDRDRTRGNNTCTVEAYKVAIHQAVIASAGLDAYTGLPLRWDLISRYDNEESKRGGRKYKAVFGDLPTADHVGDGLGPADFRICAWRTNDAKSDLTHEEFVELCRAVLTHYENRPSTPTAEPPI
jgi:hypothetical protein